MEQKDIDKYVEKKAMEHVHDLLDSNPGTFGMVGNEWVRKTEDLIRTVVHYFLTEGG